MSTTQKITPRVYLTILVMGLAYASVYNIPYMKSIFYDGMLALTGATNAELGWTLTIYGLGEVLTPGIGGILSERYDYKKIILISAFGTGAACILMVLAPSLTMALIAWTILVFSTLFMVWGSLFKAIRLLGTTDQQGTINGLYAGAMGIGYFVLNYVGILLYDSYVATDPAQGMRNVFIGFAAAVIVFNVAAYFMLKITPTAQEEIAADADTNIFKQFGECAKEKGVWFFGGLMFFLYSTNISMQYFTPYFGDVLGVSVVFGGVVAIIRQYGTRLIAGPSGGWLADKIGSLAKLMLICFIFMALSIVIVLYMPDGLRTVGFLTALVLILAFFNNAGMGLQYALVTEGKVPLKFSAAAIGMGTMLGYSPDVFQHVLFGHWLDTHGNDGYTYIFVYGLVSAVLGVVLMAVMLRWKKTQEYQNKPAV